MGVIKRMAALMKAAGMDVRDVSGYTSVHRGRGATLDEWYRLDIGESKPDPDWAVTTNRPVKSKAFKIDKTGSTEPVKRRGRSKKKRAARPKSRPASLFGLFQRLRKGEKK